MRTPGQARGPANRICRAQDFSLVFHLDGDKPTMDYPDQMAKGIPVQVECSGRKDIHQDSVIGSEV